MKTNNIDFKRLFIFALADGTADNANIQLTSSEHMAPEIKTYYDLRLIRKAGPKLVYAQFAGKTPLPANSGNSIEFRGFKDLDTNPENAMLTEGKTPDGQNLVPYAIVAELINVGTYVSFSDVIMLTAIDLKMKEIVDKLSNQASVILDKLIRNTLISHDEVGVTYAGRVDGLSKMSVANSKISVADIRFLVNILKRVNAPTIDGMYPLVLHPDVVLDLQADEEYKEMHKYARPDNLFNGYVGDVAGARIYESTNVKISKYGDKAIYWCSIIAEGAYDTVSLEGGALRTIIKPVGSSGSADPLEQRGSAGWKATTATAVKVPEYIETYACCASYNAVEDAEDEITAA